MYNEDHAQDDQQQSTSKDEAVVVETNLAQPTGTCLRQLRLTLRRVKAKPGDMITISQELLDSIPSSRYS